MKLSLFIRIITFTTVGWPANDEKPVSQQTNVVEAQARTNSAGSFTIKSGRMVFATIQDFVQTRDYLSGASEARLDSFRQTVSIETSARAYAQYRSEFCCGAEPTQAQLEAWDNQFASKVAITTNSDGEKEAAPKYKAYAEFANLNGEFQVGTTLIKQAGTKLISILNPASVNLANVNEATPANPSQGIYVVETQLPAASLGCCLAANSNELKYVPSGLMAERRIKAIYLILDQTIIGGQDPVNPNFVVVLPRITVAAHGFHDKKKCFAFCWWKCEKTNLKHDFSITFTHNFSGSPMGIASPITFTGTKTANTCDNEFILNFDNIFSQAPGLPLPSLSVCVSAVSQTVTKLSDSKKVSFRCPM
jgi:hypothetical protein